MPDVTITDVPDDVLAAVDASATRLGLSRGEYLRRLLAAERHRGPGPTTVEDLRHFAELCADLADPEVMARAWR